MKTRLALSVLLACASGACVSGEGPDSDAGGGAGGAGAGGQAGTAGTAGSGGGAAGTTGTGGAAGSVGGSATGRGGAGGSAGSSGGTATGGAGNAGKGGSGGSPAGSGGRGGNAGNGGSGGSAGSAAGSSGRGGASGSGGVAGTTAGRGGGGGTAGQGGTAGTAGTAGTTGTGGTAAWLTGYTATMFGNHTAGDCNGLANFTDATNISGATCTHQGITLAPYMSGVANDSSFYGAPGDESSIWVGPTCACQPGQTENGTGMCPSAPTCNMEQDCGRCFQLKCDPSGTGTYSNGDTR
ncbi:MAG TPA: hypothetical protein VIF57_24880, partial [Polyangia bacterium]